MVKPTSCKVFSLASPCVDRIVSVPFTFVNELPVRKGEGCTIGLEEFKKILSNLKEEEGELIPGGAATNTVRGLAKLGHSCTVAGSLADDHQGRYLKENISSHSVTADYTFSDLGPTAQILSFVTPDGDRTICACPGASVAYTPNQLEKKHFEGCDLAVFESYSFRNDGLLERALELAHKAGATVALGLSATDIIQDHRHALLDLLPQYVDLLFANQDEARALTGIGEATSAIAISMLTDLAVVTHGPEGCWIGTRGEEAVHYPTLPIDAVDATGAGDLFMAGFLHGHIQKKPVETCVAIGSLAGAAVTQVTGPIISEESWKELLAEIDTL